MVFNNEVEVEFSSELVVQASDELLKDGYLIEFHFLDNKLIFDELNGRVFKNDTVFLEEKVPFQSVMTGLYADQFAASGSIKLPKFDQTFHLHLHLLTFMRAIWPVKIRIS